MLRSLKAFYLATATGGCFLFFWSGSWLLSWLVLPLVRILTARRSPLERTRACQQIVGLGFRLFLGTMPLQSALDLNKRGTDAYGQSQYREALNYYQQALAGNQSNQH